MAQFQSFRASELYCSKCGKSMPVRERLLLVLPDKELYEYLCTQCASSLGTREVSQYDKMMAMRQQQREMQRRRRRIPAPGNGLPPR
jgi:hypothetical protein